MFILGFKTLLLLCGSCGYGFGMRVDKRVVALAAILATCKSKPRLDGRRLIIWRDVRRILDKYGIRYKAYGCMFTYSRGFGRKHEDTWSVQTADGYRREFIEYTRHKVVVTDYEVAVKALELLSNPKKAKAVFARHVDIVREVFLNLPSISARVFEYFHRRTLRRAFHLNYTAKILHPREYRQFTRKQVVRELMPNWRGMRFMQLKIYGPEELGLT